MAGTTATASSAAMRKKTRFHVSKFVSRDAGPPPVIQRNRHSVKSRSCARQEPEQAPRPQAERCRDNGAAHVPGILQQARPFQAEAPDVNADEQAKYRAGGYDVCLHGTSFRIENVPLRAALGP